MSDINNLKTILDFYSDHGVDGVEPLNKSHYKFNFKNVYYASSYEYERCHHWVQHAFPISTVSHYNPDAPLMTDEMADLINRNHPHVVSDMQKMLIRYCGTIGIYLYLRGEVIINSDLMSRHLQNGNSHIALRVTRMLHFCNLMKFIGLKERIRKGLHKWIGNHNDEVSQQAIKHWFVLTDE